MLAPLEKLNRALRDNRPRDFLSTRHRELELGMRPLHFGPGTSLMWQLHRYILTLIEQIPD